MTDAPLLQITGIVRQYGGPQPLRISQLIVRKGERVVLEGLDTGAAESLIHLITGAALPDEGDLRVAGKSTRDIATDTEWLTSLDRLGIVTARAVLIDKLPIAANLALPLTLSIEPIPDEHYRKVASLAAEAGLSADRLSAPASTLTPEERVRAHLARALALDPALLLLEDPTAALDPAAAHAFGATLRALSGPRGLAWIAMSGDDRFARASGATRLRVTLEGAVTKRGWWRWVS